MTVKAIPKGVHTLTPHLTVPDAKKAIAFYEEAFGAKLLSSHEIDGGKVMHASLQLGNSQFFLNDPFGPTPDDRSGFTMTIATENADAAWERATKAGAEVHMPLENQFWGDRYGVLKDPFGISWAIVQHIEDLSEEEIVERGRKAMAEFGSG